MTASTATNVIALLEAAATRHPDRVALIGPTETARDDPITFQALRTAVQRAAAGWNREGIAPGDHVLLMVPMSVDLYVALASLLTVGAVVAFFDPWMPRPMMAAVADALRPRAFVGSPRACLVRWTHPALRRIPLVVTTGNGFLTLGASRRLSRLGNSGGAHPIHAADADDAALVTYTTGSSGRPKGASRTHGVLVAQHRALTACFPPHDDDVDMTAFPVFALNNLALGIPTVVPPVRFSQVAAADPRVLHDHARTHDVRTCTLSPPLLDRLADGIRRYGPLSLRRVLVGGAPTTGRQLERWTKAFPDAELVVIYGSTEAQPMAYIPAADRLRLERAAVGDDLCLGPPAPGLRARVIRIHRGPVALDERGWSAWDVATGEVGEFLVTGDRVCREYHLDPAATAAGKVADVACSVWHRTGDTGIIDAAGCLWLVGRVHTSIRRGGGWLHSLRIERAVRRHLPGIEQVAVLGVPAGGEDAKLIVVLHGSADDPTLERLRAALAAEGVAPDEIVLDGRPLPVDPRHNAKLDDAALRARLDHAWGIR